MVGKGALLILLISILFALYFAPTFISIANGFAAKVICSEIFTGGWDAQFTVDQEINSLQLPILFSSIDKDSVSVYTFFNLFKRTAKYDKNSQTCTLLPENPETILKNSKIIKKNIPENREAQWPAGTANAYDFENENINYENLNLILDAAFHEPVVDGVGIFRRTRAVAVLYDGKIIAERYAPQFNANSRFNGWSMTKSLFATLIGARINDGKLKLDQQNLFPEWENDARANITLDSLLRASSGLEFNEANALASDTTNMLFFSPSTSDYAINKPLVPSQGWKYSSGTSNILSNILRRSFDNDDDYWNYVDHFFTKINVNSLVIDTDPSGNFIASSFSHATLRDWARFSLFASQKGEWLGEQILPKSWFDYSFTPTPSAPLARLYFYYFS